MFTFGKPCTFFWALSRRLWKYGFHLCDCVYVCQYIRTFSYTCVYRENPDTFMYHFFKI